jgi:hypothetical protein
MRGVMTTVAWGLALAATAAVAGCGGGSPSHPDTGYGANQTVPTSVSCASLCQRSVDCFGQLCDEDTNSTMYVSLEPLLLSECQASCTDTQLQSEVSAAAWTCLFTDTCRQVFGENSCHVPNASYKCQ